LGAAPISTGHSVATELYRRTKDLALVKDFLGHANIMITDQCYRGPDEEQIKQDVLSAMEGSAAPNRSVGRPSLVGTNTGMFVPSLRVEICNN
jgi:hypothetical protein